VNDLTGFYALNRVHQSGEQRAVVLHAVTRYVNNHDSEREFSEIMLMLKTLVGCHEDITFALCLGNQLGVRERAPFSLGDGQDFVTGERLPQAGIDALV